MKRIFLIGYMGAGKTTVGKDLSEYLDLTFIDLDQFIEGRYSQSVKELFTHKGEDCFREIERKILHEVAEFEDVIISLGGGTPCFFDNMTYLNRKGTSVYLQVPIEELAKRLEKSPNVRPIVQGKSGCELRSFIRENLDKREPFYRQADILFNAEKMMTYEDIHEISKNLSRLI